MMYLGTLTLIQHEVIGNETVLRYLTGHPVSKITLAMFFIGLASLGMIGFNVFEQFAAESKIRLPVAWPESGQEDKEHQVGQTKTEDSDSDLSSLAPASPDNPAVARAIFYGQWMLDMPRWMHEHYLWQRIVNALHSVYRTKSAENIEDELKYLADLDLDRQIQRYSLVRILIWATPMLGFLGTVLGISQALGGISVGPENDFQQMMDGLRGSLYVAFDTTALALTLSMILMFGQFLVDRFESQLLQLVDQRARSEVASVFIPDSADSPRDNAVPLGKISREILHAMNSAVQSQTEIWRKTIRAAEQAWTSSLSEVSGQVQDNLTAALDESVCDLAHYLGESIEKADDSMAHRWQQWQVMLSDNARQLESHQKRLLEQTQLIQELVIKTEDTALFEPAITNHRDAVDETNRLHQAISELSHVVADLAQDQESNAGELPADADVETKESVGDVPEVILPFPINHVETVAAEPRLESGQLPEVIIPFPKQAA